jgi:DNA-directed RNA polymerase subunit RPC12/RpoP
MTVACPRCNSKRLRILRHHGLMGIVQRIAGIERVVCRDCGAKFQQSVLGIGDLLYAKCPRCFRTDLSTWDLRHYSPRLGIRMKLKFGAQRFRCDRCRMNFASFRPRQEWPERSSEETALIAADQMEEKEKGSK